MRIAILADTHMPRGKRQLPAKCLEMITGAELVLHAGDFMTASVLEELEAIGPPVVAVWGNMDDAELRRRLPERRTVDIEGASIGLIHDAGAARGRIERLRTLFPDADGVVFAHSHLPLHECSGAFQIFNPGSPTERRRAPTHTMGIATVANGAVRFRHVDLD